MSDVVHGKVSDWNWIYVIAYVFHTSCGGVSR